MLALGCVASPEAERLPPPNHHHHLPPHIRTRATPTTLHAAAPAPPADAPRPSPAPPQDATLLRARLHKAELDRQALQGRLEAETLARAQARTENESLQRICDELMGMLETRKAGGGA